MTRNLTFLDRLATLLIGLTLIALGVGAVLWATEVIDGFPERLTAPELVTAAQTSWWPWALAAAGIILVLLSVRWLTLHSPAPKAKTVQLAGSEKSGRLGVELGAVADATARALEQQGGIHTAKGKAIVDQGVRTLDFDVTANSPDDLATVVSTVDALCRDAVTMIGDDTVATRTRIHIDKARHDSGRAR